MQTDLKETETHHVEIAAESMPAPPSFAQLSGAQLRRPSVAAASSYQVSVDQPQREVDEPQQISHQVSPTARGFLASFRLMVIAAALVLSFVIPWLLVTNLINPLIVWLICLFGAILQAIYHLPVLIMEIIGMIRGRPCKSAWLQSGMDLTFNLLFLIPWLLTAGLLSIAAQIPVCPRLFKPPQPDTLAFVLQTIPGKGLAKNYPTCQTRDIVVILAIANLVLWGISLALTAFAVAQDYKYQKQWYQHLLETMVDPDRPQARRVKTLRYLKEHSVGEPRRRWMTGTGQLLSEIEGAMAMLRREKNRHALQRHTEEAQPVTERYRDEALELSGDETDQATAEVLRRRTANEQEGR